MKLFKTKVHSWKNCKQGQLQMSTQTLVLWSQQPPDQAGHLTHTAPGYGRGPSLVPRSWPGLPGAGDPQVSRFLAAEHRRDGAHCTASSLPAQCYVRYVFVALTNALVTAPCMKVTPVLFGGGGLATVPAGGVRLKLPGAVRQGCCSPPLPLRPPPPPLPAL